MTICRKLTLDEIEWSVEVDYDDIPVRGNALVSGDDAVDKACEDEILARLDDGDVWAWASVCVRGRFRGLEATTYLGACSYADEYDFKQPDGYYQQMQTDVLAELQDALEDLVDAALSSLN